MKITSICYWSNHSVVKWSLICHHVNVPMMYRALYWEEQAGHSTVCISHKARYPVFVMFSSFGSISEGSLYKMLLLHCLTSCFSRFSGIIRGLHLFQDCMHKVLRITLFPLGAFQWGSLQSFCFSLTNKRQLWLQLDGNGWTKVGRVHNMVLITIQLLFSCLVWALIWTVFFFNLVHLLQEF